MNLDQLRRIRWGCRAVLGVAVTLSVVGNVLHAPHDRISQGMSALPPLVLWATIELITKVPTTRPVWTWGRRAVCLGIGGMAAWISYWHMAAVAARYGETMRGSAYLYPLLVDCLVVVAWICLVELADRIRGAEVSPTAPSAGMVFAHAQPIGPMPAPKPLRVETVSPPKPAERKPHPSSKERVEKAHQRTPNATDEQLAARLQLTTRTVKTYRPPRPEPAQSNGHLEEVKS